MKEYARDFYLSSQWRHVRKMYLEQQHYVCERCGKPATIVHHRKYITPANINNPSITLNTENLEALCQDCHNKEHMAKHSRAVFDEAGNMIGCKPSSEIQEYEKQLRELQRQPWQK